MEVCGGGYAGGYIIIFTDMLIKKNSRSYLEIMRLFLPIQQTGKGRTLMKYTLRCGGFQRSIFWQHTDKLDSWNGIVCKDIKTKRL